MKKLAFLLSIGFLFNISAAANYDTRDDLIVVRQERSNTSLINNNEFIMIKEVKGCRIIVFHEQSGTGFVDKSLCTKGE